MPYSPIPKFPEIIRDLKNRKYKEVRFEDLKFSVMKITGAVKPITIKQTIQAMEDLKYIRPVVGGFTWELMTTEPGKFEIDAKENTEKEADKFLNDIEKAKIDG